MQHAAIWIVAGLSILGVIVRPWRIPEWVFACSGAIVLPIFGWISWSDTALAIGKGADVCMFLAGMMLLSELARREGLFDFLAASAVNHARGSASRLFLLTYAIGVVVTAFMSNDATAVVLTPAVYAAARHARANPLPYLFVCAFIANAASFVLPISNPANLVIFGERMPPLTQWLAAFAIPSILAIVATHAVHRCLHRGMLAAPIDSNIDVPVLSRAGKIAGYGIVIVAVALLAASFLGMPLGWPTLAASSAVVAIVLLRERKSPWPLLKRVSWGVLLLVAGLFVLVEGLARTGLVAALGTMLRASVGTSGNAAAASAGVVTAFATNLFNNLPLGLIAGSALHSMPAADGHGHAHALLQGAITIGIDIGPNLSVTGSLATILWLTAIRHEGEDVSAWQFLRLGIVVMPLALLGALSGLLLANAL